MVDLPSNVNYGHVVGQLIEAWGDGVISPGDSDTYPDARACSGSITFTAAPTYLADETAAPNKVTIFPKPIVCGLDDNGYLTDPDGNLGVYLVADDDPDLNPTGWNWTAAFRLDGVAQFSRTFSVRAGVTIDLTDILNSSVPPSGGTSTIVTPSAVLSVAGGVGDVSTAFLAAALGLAGKVDGLNGVTGLWQGTAAAYAAIVTPNPNVVYIVH